MLSEKDLKRIKFKLDACSEVYSSTELAELVERNRGYCQGVAFVLDLLGYSMQWDNGKVIIVNNKDKE